MAAVHALEAEVVPAPIPAAAEQEYAYGDQRVDLWGVTWESYVAINDALPEGSAVRAIYIDGRLTLLGKSRRHDWFAEILGALVQALSNRLEIPWEFAGQATYRLAENSAGIEGDKTFYFREHAIRMSGPVNIDLATQPPPDLAIEVVVSHPADVALKTWGRLGVPEVWTYNPVRRIFAIWSRAEDGSYTEVPTSLGLPGLTSADLLAQMKEAEEMRASDWFKRVTPWCEAIARRPSP